MNKCPMCGFNLIVNKDLGEEHCENEDECEYATFTIEKTKELFGEDCFGDEEIKNET